MRTIVVCNDSPPTMNYREMFLEIGRSAMSQRNPVIFEERVRPGVYESTYECQPFLSRGELPWDMQALTQEQMAYALGQVTASNVLQSLTLLENG